MVKYTWRPWHIKLGFWILLIVEHLWLCDWPPPAVFTSCLGPLPLTGHYFWPNSQTEPTVIRGTKRAPESEVLLKGTPWSFWPLVELQMMWASSKLLRSLHRPISPTRTTCSLTVYYIPDLDICRYNKTISIILSPVTDWRSAQGVPQHSLKPLSSVMDGCARFLQMVSYQQQQAGQCSKGSEDCDCEVTAL